MKKTAKPSPLTRDALQEALTRKVAEVVREPEHHWGGGIRSYMTEGRGLPVVRVAATNCASDFDLWQGLRSPALVGMYPIGLRDIWMHYAAMNVKSTRSDGSPNPLAMPEPFEDACRAYRRAVVVSAMLASNPEIYEGYAQKIERGELDPLDTYAKRQGEVSAVLHKALGKLALSLMSPDRAVVPMTGKNVANVIERTRSEYLKGRYHGPCNNHFPQNSVAVLAGLMRFGVCRLPFRDEADSRGKIRRLFGRYASIVIFDRVDVVADDAGGVSLLDARRLEWLRRLSNYTDVSKDAVAGRYCTYNLTKRDGASVCGKCVAACPAGALANSTPGPDGKFSERLLAQKHRFDAGAIDFDFGNCSRDRNQKAELYEDYVCARCEAVCAARGIRKSAADVRRINSASEP
jgi:ferredoxin